MSDKTEEQRDRLTPEMARQALHDDHAPDGLMGALEAIAYERCVVIERAELERLRADARRLAAVFSIIEVDIIDDIDLFESACQFACEAGREEPTDEDHLQAMRCAIDAAMQKESPRFSGNDDGPQAA